MPEASFTALTDEGAALLDPAGVRVPTYPFRTSETGKRSYAADGDDLAAVPDRLRPDWREHVEPV